jgi:hypothetical protein
MVRRYSDMVTLPSERFDELIVAEAIATAHTAQPSNIDIAALLSHGIVVFYWKRYTRAM